MRHATPRSSRKLPDRIFSQAVPTYRAPYRDPDPDPGFGSESGWGEWGAELFWSGCARDSLGFYHTTTVGGFGERGGREGGREGVLCSVVLVLYLERV